MSATSLLLVYVTMFGAWVALQLVAFVSIMVMLRVKTCLHRPVAVDISSGGIKMVSVQSRCAHCGRAFRPEEQQAAVAALRSLEGDS